MEPDVRITVVKLSEKEKEDLYNKWVRGRMSIPQRRALKRADKK